MLNDITLGQYFPGDSVLHRLDPRMKIIVAIAYITAIFLAGDIYTLSGVFVISIAVVALSKIPFSIILKALKPLIFIIAFTVAINVFMAPGEDLLFRLGFLKIYSDGLLNAALMVMRLICLVSVTSVFISYTTSPTMLTEAIERLLSPLSKIRLPVHEFAMMMTLALRMIPVLIDETDKIINAQKARGADFYSGNILKRAKALVPVLIPLIVSAFKRADELATAMECRCYQGGRGRTKMKQLRYGARDLAAFMLSAAFVAAVAVVPKFLGGIVL
ncbi:MAG: energy-coupling factor transporter transmembrane protein EcfT [Oscillospiraceae bacterium]|nr:energy-coupling factor transporter transmembrane protein EcfT [Oscillospiraceae bacterium]